MCAGPLGAPLWPWEEGGPWQEQPPARSPGTAPPPAAQAAGIPVPQRCLFWVKAVLTLLETAGVELSPRAPGRLGGPELTAGSSDLLRASRASDAAPSLTATC